MQKSEKYLLMGIVAASVALAIIVYLSGNADQIIEKVRSSNLLKGKDIENNGGIKNFIPRIANKELDDAVSKIKADPKFQDRTIVKDTDTSGGGGGGGSSNLQNQAAACMNSNAGAGSGYYVKAKLEKIETVYNEGRTALISRTYATADEYDKGNSTSPDLVPEDLLIVGAAAPGAQEGTQIFEGSSVFQYIYMQNDGGGFSTGC